MREKWVPTHLAIMVGTATECEDKTEEDESNDDDDLEAAEPELKFAEELDAEVVHGNDDDEDHGYEDAWIDLLAGYPIL